MNKNSDNFWSNEWIGILTCNLKSYIERDGALSELSYQDVISNMLEVNESLKVLDNLSDQGIKVDYLSDINNVYLLTKECASKPNALKILFNNVANNLGSFLKSQGYNLTNYVSETKLTNKERLKELEIAKFESVLRSACSLTNDDAQKLSRCKDQNELLDETATILVNAYRMKKMESK